MKRAGFFFFALVFLTVVLAPNVKASAPTAEPILRIETGMHGAAISRIATDAANRWLVTGSDDKTVRVWDLVTGGLVRVLRPPIGEGTEGMIYAVALSPDGRTVACGGWTRAGSDIGATIYLFDLTTGQQRHRLTGLPNVILHLVFSRDGRHLAATLGGANGLRVYRTLDWTEAARDADYGDRSYGADFAPDGRLATTSYDGHIRLYDAGFQPLAKVKAPGGNQPFSVAFSPDGARIALGFADSRAVNVLAGRDLAFLYAPDTTGVANGNLGNVAFSDDGQWLFAGGMWDQGGQHPLRRWAAGGRGSYTDLLPGAQSTIMHILPLAGGGIAWGAADPAWGVLNARGERSLLVGPALADFRGMRYRFLVASAGGQVQFWYEEWGKSPAVFSLFERELRTAETALSPGNLQPPRTAATGLTVTDWVNKTTPALNGKGLKLEPHELSRSLAIAPDGQSFLLGTVWRLRLFDKEGNERWQLPLPASAWAVNIAGNGQVALAALGDGTIRWYRLTDGRELLALFPHPDRRRWVLWTPAGYYDAAPGAEDLIGWHVNRGRDQAADFFPVGQFRNQFYRPDVLARVLETLDVPEALRLANLEAGRKLVTAPVTRLLPPVVTLLSPQDGETVSGDRVTLRYLVRTAADAPVTAVRALLDGRPAETLRGIRIVGVVEGAGEQTLDIPLPGRDSEVAIIAENRHGPSEPARARLKRPPATRAEFVIKPKLYALLVGVSAYRDQSLKLNYAAKDARDFAALLQKQQGKLYREVTVRLLTDAEALKDEILDGLDWVRRAVTRHDVGIVFLAGHGVNDADGTYYYLPVQADQDRLLRTGVRYTDIQTTLASMPGKALFFVDTCHAGSVMGRRGNIDLTRLINELSSAESGAVVFAASTGRQFSLEDERWQNGAFTKALVEGLSGKADYQKDGVITIKELDLYISERVKELTKGKQSPTTTIPKTIPDFPVVMY